MSKYKLLAKFMYKIQRFMQEGLGFDLFLEEQELFPREGSDWHEQELMKVERRRQSLPGRCAEALGCVGTWHRRKHEKASGRMG